jgi:PAS domain S-box-containing protein
MKLNTFAQEIEDMWSRVVVLQNKSEALQAQPQQLEIVAQVSEELRNTTEELYLAYEQLQELVILLEEQNQLLKAAYREAEAQRQRYQELFDFAPEAYLVTSKNGVIIESNHAANSLLNTSQSFLVDETIDMYIVSPKNLSMNQLLINLGEIIGVNEFEVRLQPRDKTPITCVCRVREVSNPNSNEITLHWVIRDVTEQKQSQQSPKQTQPKLYQELLKEKSFSDLKSRIITTTSHEFRTPLTTILSSAEMLEHYRHKWNDSKQLTHIHRIQNSAKHLTRLFNDILTLSNIEVNKQSFNPASLDLVNFCSGLVEELLVSDNNRHAIAFSTRSQCVLGNFDAKLLRRILYNLLSNALKFSPIYSTIHLTLACFESNARFEITDFGIGIPIEDLPHIFEPFYRASNVTNIPGSGLGMTLVKEAVDLHSGQIHVSSVLEVGTAFTVSLPLQV